jgi:hypothetical protein
MREQHPFNNLVRVALAVGTRVMGAQRKKLSTAIRLQNLFRPPHHEEHQDSPQGPLADYCESSDDSIEFDENEYCLHLNNTNKRIAVKTHRKRRREGFSNNAGEEMSSRHERNHQDRALALNDIYFQQLGKYHNNTAPPPVTSFSSAPVWRHPRSRSGKENRRNMKTMTSSKILTVSRNSKTKTLS